MRNSRRGDYGGNFRRRNERNRLLFTTRIETVLFRMIKNQYVFLSRNVLSTFRLFLNKVNTNGRNHDSKYSNRSHRALRAELLIKKKNQCIISVHFSTKQSYQRARERKKFSRNRLRTISFHLWIWSLAFSWRQKKTNPVLFLSTPYLRRYY